MSISNSSLPRYEIKFIAEPLEYHRVLNWLRQHNSCLETEYPDRQVNNIYFDSHNHHSYCDNIYGSSSKSKVRFRWYGNSKEPQNGSLEIKCKRNQLNWKLIYKVQEELGGCDWRTLCSEIRRQLPAEGKKWMEMNPLPVLINRYQRKYFVSRDKKVRVTLDSDLDIYDQSRKRFPNYSSKSNLPKVLVLEVKFPRELRDHVVHMFGGIPLRASRFSKYVSGFLSINH
ncbi:MAG: VTC domain-containing protein [Nitrospina sp.]|jgi:SPX domain protein involved in polyphosphate accumulation|nr:VTC domain-containing protein [Nitrospina sp.]MBT3414162.1 VTC domain-containing protein [Nitrospina sp.]MBT3857047.1 VTC domain-containing protein [Nitrospina sp.]MBT4103602.1 VTC domain-containing protein [Nitrospina sp.]MBT4390319.1 VTC domain-containing protein [Nitrospina sp.]